MTEKNWDYIAKLEKLISEKYGKESIINPKSLWNEEKETQYLQQIKELSLSHEQNDILQTELGSNFGVFLTKKLFNRENRNVCFLCKKYSFNKKDDLFLTKYKCCCSCYYEHIEGREEKWLQQMK